MNVSGRQLSEPGLASAVSGALRDHSLSPSVLTLELTETAMVTPGGHELAVLRDVREAGVRLALDGFGTGFSSLAHLQRFHVDDVKVDRSFVAALGRSRRGDKVTRSAVGLALDLGCGIAAEGIEEDAQVDALLALGVEQRQGFGLAKPMLARAVGCGAAAQGPAPRAPARRPARRLTRSGGRGHQGGPCAACSAAAPRPGGL